MAITGWRRNQPVFGKPDFVFQKIQTRGVRGRLFLHGCPEARDQAKNQSYNSGGGSWSGIKRATER